MSSASDGNGQKKTMTHVLQLVSAVAVALALSACTVRPLYYQGGADAPGSLAASLASVEVAEVTTRPAQEVRNHLIFLLSGGATRTASPNYRLSLRTRTGTTSAADLQSGDIEDPTAKTVTVTAIYSLVDLSTGTTVSRGWRDMTAAFDVPRQNFAALRAERDGENRAARELAEQLHLAVAQDIGRYESGRERRLSNVALDDLRVIPEEPRDETDALFDR